MNLRDVLESASNANIAAAIESSYREIVRHFVLRNWKTAGVDAGHFVEAVRRLLRFSFSGLRRRSVNPCPSLTTRTLKKYEGATGDESYRILIPRVLWGLYALRNKRSIGHLGAVPAGEIDATILLYGAKWILSEIVRLNSTAGEQETRALVHQLVERQEAAVWREDEIIRVLDPKIQARDQALLILSLTGEKSEDDLRRHVQYSNSTNFRKILKRLDASKLIAYSSRNVLSHQPVPLRQRKSLKSAGCSEPVCITGFGTSSRPRRNGGACRPLQFVRAAAT